MKRRDWMALAAASMVVAAAPALAQGYPTRPVKQWELEPESESWIKPVIRGAAAALGLKPPRTDR